MTSRPVEITVRCPSCGERFQTHHRPSWNRDLDPVTDEELAEPSGKKTRAHGKERSPAA